MTIPDDVKSTVTRLLAGLDTPRALTVKLMVDYGEWAQIAKLNLNPDHYLDCSAHALKFGCDFQATELLRKCADLPCASPKDRREAAREGWLDSERLNAATNARLTPWLTGYPSEMGPAMASAIWGVIQKARKEIRRVLGPLPETLHLERFGPGTYHGWLSEERLPTLADKLASDITVSPEALPIFRHLFPFSWERAFWECGSNFVLIDSEAFSTVPKNALTDRTIGKQPLGNLVCQLAVGRHIRRRLRAHAHIDLEYGQDAHARTACAASVSNEDATVDLRNASNSLASIVPKLLLPEAWWELLDSLRVKKSLHTVKGGTRCYKLEMFSAMGNGFTFELETLTFWALARAIGVERPMVYGDDMIVPVKHVNDLVAVLRYFGFETNSAKTFVSGPFRESCGGNYFAGHKLSPLRIATFPKEPHEWISLHNGLWRAGITIGAHRTRRARLAALRYLPSDIRRMGGPTALGDLVLHGPDVFNRHPPTLRGGITFWRTWSPVQHKWPFNRFGGGALQSAMALIGISSDGVGYRDNVTGHASAWVPWS